MNEHLVELGVIVSVLLALVTLVNARVSRMAKKVEANAALVNQCVGSIGSVGPTVKLAVLEALRDHEERENVKLKDLHTIIQSVQVDVAGMKADVSRAINGQQKRRS